VSDQESALLVTARDEAGMAGAMERILSRTEEGARLAARGYELVLQHYTPDLYMQRLIQFYERAIHRSDG
jgi:glycosyltransferase involved in cell wall biosynthesis